MRWLYLRRTDLLQIADRRLNLLGSRRRWRCLELCLQMGLPLPEESDLRLHSHQVLLQALQLILHEGLCLVERLLRRHLPRIPC